jgi:hypothetical protein
MIVPRRHFRDFFCGRAGETPAVAELRDDIGVFISSQAKQVSMRRDYAIKMLVKHRLTYEHLHTGAVCHK